MLRDVLRLGLHETRRYRPAVSPRFLLGAAVLGVLLAATWPLISSQTVDPDAGIYAVEADPDSPILPILRSDSAFDLMIGVEGRFQAGRADLLVTGEDVVFDERNAKSSAAARELEFAARAWLDAQMRLEPDEAAAFPVRVNLVFQTRQALENGDGTGPGPDGDEGSQPQLLNQTGDRETGLTPSEVEPPFPMESLLLTFAYLIPMNFLGQFYSGSFYAERVRRRGVLLLSTPMSGGEVLLGKSLPYLVVSLLFAIGVTVVIGAGIYGFLASLPIIGFVLATSLLLALVAPHPRALTFLLVAVTTLLSTFLFLPAVFVEIHPVAFISPVTVIATSIRQEPISLGQFLYATVPLTLVTVVLAALTVPLYREESLFSPRGMLSKLTDAVDLRFRTPLGLLGAGVLTVPFAMGLELFVLVFAIALDVRAAFVLFIFGAAMVEEALKALPLYAHLGRPKERHVGAALSGLLVGGGFFLGEKLALLLGLVGFGLLDLGPQVLATFGIASNVLLIAAPLALHVTTATLTAFLATRGARGALAGWWLASLVHVGYNLLVIRLVGGGLF